MSPTMRGAATLLAAAAWAAFVVLATQAVAGRIATDGIAGARAVEAGATLILFGLLAAPALWLARRAGDLHGTPVWGWAAIGAAMGIGGLSAAMALAALAGGVVATGTAADGAGALLAGTLLVLFQSAAEELFFRGWLQRALTRDWGPVPAFAATAAAFALLHLLGGARAPLSLVNLLLGGVVFGLLAQRSGGLAAPIAMHGGWNWAEQMLWGLDPNPGTGNFGALFDHDITGSALWGGSDEGLNASLAMTIVLAALLLPLWARTPVARPDAVAA